ncbi:DNA cytosine methyltransferase [Nitrosopumilus sp.]|uniref:DNA cytosine methyltransferase n=1 Tax=Nitrosopumilus sp. TaxID=2024843 RepID=UPI003D149A29
MTQNNIPRPKVISLFTCGMGMDSGFEKAGFQTVYANDITKFACDTIKEVKKKELKEQTLHLDDEKNIFEITSDSILSNVGLAKGESDVLIGGPPCQSFSTAGMRKGLKDKRGMAVMEYIKKIKEIKPKAFVFENVQGIKSMAMSHISFYDRIVMDESKLDESQKRGSLFTYIENEFRKLEEEEHGYSIDYDILNAADFGVPQNRKRFILIGIRNEFGNATEVLNEIKSKAKYADPRKAKKLGKKEWRTLETLKDKFEGENPPDCAKFSNSVVEYMSHVPKEIGGCWVDLPPELKKKAMGGAADTDDPRRKGKQGGRTGFYRRLSWYKPSPTLVTSPTQMGTCMCHPTYDRPLSLKEYALIQGFPANWKFQGSLTNRYRMIGEAVPVEMAKTIADTIKKHIDNA